MSLRIAISKSKNDGEIACAGSRSRNADFVGIRIMIYYWISGEGIVGELLHNG